MRTLAFLASVACGLFAFGPGEVRAQYYPGGGAGVASPPYNYNRPPTVSPMLDLRRGANTPALNYFLGTRPEYERRQDAYQLRQLERDFATSQSTPGLLEGEDINRLQQTGHATYFMNLAPYYYPMAQSNSNRPGMQPPRGGAAGAGGRPMGYQPR
jgi:hypothetical protein